MAHGRTPDLAKALASLLEATLADASMADLWHARGALTRTLNTSETEQFELFFGQLLSAYEQRLGTDARVLRLGQYSDTLSEVMASENMHAVLSALAEGVRRIADSDTAFLALRDPKQDDVRMMLTRGTVSTGMQDLRLDLGAGIGGSVSVTGEAFATGNYLTDPRISHDPAVDKVVADEGLQRMIGLPLVSDAEVLGVMFASNRSPRNVPPEAQALINRLLQNAGNLMSWINRSRHQNDAQHNASVEHLLVNPHSVRQKESPALGVLLNKRLLHAQFSHYMSELDSFLMRDSVMVAAQRMSSQKQISAFEPHVNPFTTHWCTVDDTLVFLVHADDSNSAKRQLSGAMPDANVVSAPVTEVPSLWDTFITLDSRLETLRVQAASGTPFAASELYSVIFGGLEEAIAFVRRHLRRVWEFDEQNNAEIGLTLATYLNTGLHHRETAKRLHIHANTLYRRFENVNRILGPQWLVEVDLLELQLALRIAHLVPEMERWAHSWVKS